MRTIAPPSHPHIGSPVRRPAASPAHLNLLQRNATSQSRNEPAIRAPPEITNQTQIHAARCNIPVQSHPTALPHSNPCVFYAILALPRRPGTQQMQQCNTQFQISPRKRNEPKPAPVRRQNHQPPATNHQPPRGRRPPTAGGDCAFPGRQSSLPLGQNHQPPATNHQPPAGSVRPGPLPPP
jgi:hypothetical protein